ncbi:hypothetical protein WSM22_23840 [Cytophagales bacterium WSM2-2]|nr:hypothetical protein WSM22_23840 [Cytophagales bacterium WSM2-2]
MSFRTKVNEDGSLDKSISFEKAAEDRAITNVFGISEKTGWSVNKDSIPHEKKDKEKEKKFHITLYKHFVSDAEMNKELDTRTDTLFQVTSSFQKKYRWFYTYITYSETIHPINRFKLVSPADYFNQEDSSYLKRLPGEGKSISKADSVYLDMFSQKTDRFANMGIFREYYQALEEIIRRNGLDKKWLDTLRKSRNDIYKEIESKPDLDNAFDKLKLPLSKEKIEAEMAIVGKDSKSRLDFMKYVHDGKYTNEFEMPWTVISSNADSVAGNKLYWRPTVHKFIFMDYKMAAESRKINLLELIVSAIVVSLTAFVLWRGSRSQA